MSGARSSAATSASGPQKRGVPRFTPKLAARPLRSQHDQRKLVLAALCAPDTDDVVLALSEGAALRNVHEMLGGDFALDAGNRAAVCSFQRVGVPLCALLASDGVAHCVHTAAARHLYAAADGAAHFWPRVVRCAAQLYARDGFAVARAAHAEASAYDPPDMLAVLAPIVRLAMLLLTRLVDSPADPKWPPLLAELEPLVERAVADAAERGSDAARRARAVRTDLQHARTQVTAVRRRDEAAAAAQNAFGVRESLRVAQEMQFEASVARETEPPPGALRDGGPRHDNDRADFREIAILPTAAEVECRIAPYLPIQREPELASPFVANPVDRHLDVQFRLLREDMLAPVRRAVQSFVDRRPLATLARTATAFAFQDERDASRCALFRNARIEQLVAHVRSGLALEVHFDQPLDAIARAAGRGRRRAADAPSKKARREFWEAGAGRRLLQVDSLVVLAFNAPLEREAAGENVDFVLGVVLPKGRAELSRDEARCDSLQVRPLGNDIVHAAAMLGAAPRDGCEHVLFQVRGHFYAGYEPVLRALQRQDIARLPFLERIAPPYVELAAPAVQQAELLPPAFVGDATRYDLRCVLTPEAPPATRRALAAVWPGDFAAVCALLHRVAPEHIVLDATQVDAFALALTREVSLIQGPPGTGKTYVGVQIVRALLANSAGAAPRAWHSGDRQVGVAPAGDTGAQPALSPILCVCYTNHALDQFLEHLVNDGIVPLDKVVRVGGRSQSELLATRNLSDLSHGTGFSKAGSKQYGKIKGAANELEGRLGALQERRKALERRTPREDDLRESDPELVDDINRDVMSADYVNEDDDDESREQFQIQGGFRAVLRRWLDAGDAARRARFETACSDARAAVDDELRSVARQYAELTERLGALQDATKLDVLRDASIVAFTTSGAAKYDSLLHALRPRVVVCEEAGEVFEAHVLASLTSSTESLILIGDHQQLRPKPSEYALSVETSNGHDVDVSLFERLLASGVEHRTLLTQRRMRPEISALIRAPLYPALLDHASVAAHPAARGFATPLFFLDHRHAESSEAGTASKSNEWEARMAVALVRYVVRQGYAPHQIALITPYVGQLLLLRRLLARANILMFIDERDVEASERIDADDDDDDEEPSGATQATALSSRVRLATVDNFQGEEAEIVIVSTVRNNAQGRTGFLKVDNRVNVMLSRAKHGMFVLGSARTIRTDRRAKLANAVLEQLERDGRLGDAWPLRCVNHGNELAAREPDDVPVDGGCAQECGKRKACGHVCRRQCHPDDAEHRVADCRERCQRLVEACGHACERRCSDPCGGCTVPIDVALPCGHERRDVDCAAVIAWNEGGVAPACIAQVDVSFKRCAHTRRVACGKRASAKCTAQCGRVLACGHACQRRCVECRRGKGECGPCEQACERVLMCGHECGQRPCHSADECPPCVAACNVACEHSQCGRACFEPCPACAEPCAWRCAHARCALPCASLCERPLCNARCDKELACGHRCPSLCGEACPADSCPQCAGAQRANQVVCFVMHTTLGEHAVDEPGSELLRLRCGHALTRETLDGLCQVDRFYVAIGDGAAAAARGEFVEHAQPVALSELIAREQLPDDDQRSIKSEPPRCPAPGCRAVVAGVRRYSRIMNWFALSVVQRKWQIRAQQRATELVAEIGACEARLEQLTSDDPADRALANRVRGLGKDVEQLRDETSVSSAPTHLVHERERAARARTGEPSGATVVPLVAPLALPSLIGLDVALRVVPAQVMVLTRNFIVQRRKDKSEPTAEDIAATQLRIAATLWQKARDDLHELVRLSGESRSGARARRAHLNAARVALVIADDLLSFVLPHAGDKGTAVRALARECVEFVENGDAHGTLAADGCAARAALCERLRARLTGPFYAPVSDAERRAVFDAMTADVGSGFGSFGGHWFKCENGHVYAIGECGGAMEQAACPECGAVVGGGSHQLAVGNAVADEMAQFQTPY